MRQNNSSVSSCARMLQTPPDTGVIFLVNERTEDPVRSSTQFFLLRR